MASKEAENQVSISSDKLEEVPKSMRIFSLSMRALFLENTTLTSSSTAARFEKLRDDTRNVAVAYAKGGLPLVRQCVSDIKGYFEHYIDLTKNEWWDCIADIVEEVKAHREACDALLEIHVHFISELKKLKDDATILMKERQDLAAKYEEEAEKLKTDALVKGAFGAALLLIPQVSVPAAAALGDTAMSSAKNNMDQGTEKDKKANAEIAVVGVIRDDLVGALGEFISALTCISCLFAVLQEELETFQAKGEKAMEGEEPKDIHYKIMNKKAGRVMTNCNDLIKELPSITSDLNAIPTKGLDSHYVDRLLLMVDTKMLIKMKKTVGNDNKKQVTIYSIIKGWRPLLEPYASFWGVSPQKLLVFILCVFIALFAYFAKTLL